MKIEIIRERRKTLCLKVDSSEHAVLKVPIRVSQEKVNEFLDSKRKWLEKISRKFSEDEEFEKQFCAGERAYLHGEFVGNFSEIVKNFDLMSEEKRKKAVKKFYLAHFSELEKRARELSEFSGISFVSVKPTSSKRIWGSFSRQKEMKLHFCLVCLPNHLIDYVIFHELCHSLQMNHSPRFWVNVEKFVPNYKSCKKELAKFSFLLKA